MGVYNGTHMVIGALKGHPVLFLTQRRKQCSTSTAGTNEFFHHAFYHLGFRENGTTVRGFRETINWVNEDSGPHWFQDTYSVDLWLHRGYNVGIFYWNQFSDEEDVKEAERKIYNAQVLPCHSTELLSLAPIHRYCYFLQSIT